MFSVVVATAPAPVISLAEAKQHLKVSHSAEDALIEGMVAAATQTIDGPEGWLGRAVGVQTLEARFSLLFDRPSLRLPYPPVVELLTVRYLDRSGAERSADPADFDLYGDAVSPAGSTWPWEGASFRPDAGRITYRAGYDTLPAPIRVAILLMVGDLYRNRESTAAVAMSKVPMSTNVEALLSPFRVYTL
ncbi:head-tail connector protein [uncultured Sphingomonas sp.]|uniref:head-tail connector protein n=1 Tax=uncultured Sphingomonas sp. TaxID=158754 RepID=UPI0025DD0414|nr:head-tail connector protein [uncultured Sphingomonas sp.]